MKKAAIILVAIGLAACGPNIPIANIEGAPPTTMEAAQSIRVVRTGDTIPTVVSYLGVVEGNSCRNKMWDKAASAEDALLRLRVAAANRGANAAIDVTCDEAGTSLHTNCWSSVQCKGVAVKTAD